MTTDGHAQLTEVGIKLGPSFTTWHSEAENDRPVLSMVVGAYAPIRLNPRFIFQPELEVALMGTERELSTERSNELRTCYLRLPATLRLHVTRRWQIAGGLQAGYLLAASRIDDGALTDVKEDLNALDLGMIGGTAIIVGESTDLSLRYIYGLSTVLRDDDRIFPTNRALQFTAGFRIARMNGRSHFRHRK